MGRRKREGNWITTTVCLPNETIDRLERRRESMERANPGVNYTMAAVMRSVIVRGLDDEGDDE